MALVLFPDLGDDGTMTSNIEPIKAHLEALAKTWADEYGEIVGGASADVRAFFQETASLAAQLAVEGDHDALKLLRVASWATLKNHRLQVVAQNRAVLEQGVRLLIDAAAVLSTVLGLPGIAAGAGKIADAILSREPNQSDE